MPATYKLKNIPWLSQQEESTYTYGISLPEKVEKKSFAKFKYLKLIIFYNYYL